MNLADKLKQITKNNEEFSNASQDSRVLIVDGLNNFIRNFCANPALDENGEHVGGSVGFLKSIGSMVRMFKPSRVVVVFDGPGGSQKRRAIYSEYKANRKTNTRLNRTYEYETIQEEKDNQTKQLLSLVHILQYLPVTVMSIDNVEADDVIAYLATTISERDGSSYIVSSDKDFLQLVSPKIKVYNPVMKKLYGVDEVVEKYGIHPKNFMIFRTIDGDDGDNINGVKGIAIKTINKLFPELANDEEVPWEHIYAACQEKIDFALSKKKKNNACQLILDNKDIIQRNMILMRLDEQHLGGHARDRILSQFDENIAPLNKLGLTQFLVRSRLSGSFGDLNDWIKTTFLPLTRFSK